MLTPLSRAYNPGASRLEADSSVTDLRSFLQRLGVLDLPLVYQPGGVSGEPPGPPGSRAGQTLPCRSTKTNSRPARTSQIG